MCMHLEYMYNMYFAELRYLQNCRFLSKKEDPEILAKTTILGIAHNAMINNVSFNN